ncbi:MAG: hypothetical protein P8I91_03420 [Phycisphaerales bacterium]|nr:hypothetical protein [Phycisphaerales bacterium]
MRRGLTNEMVNVVLCCSTPAVLAVSTLGSTTERIASDFLDALPVQNDFEAAALTGSLTDIQKFELNAVIVEFEHARSALLKKTATRLEPACELILTIPKNDEQHEHLDTLEEFGVALELAKISVSRDVLALRRDLHNQATPYLGPTQTNLWRDALDSAVRNRVLDPKNRSAEGVDLSAACDLETIPDLQLIASWAIRSSEPNLVDPKLIEQVTDRLSEGARDIQAAFDRSHHQHHSYATSSHPWRSSQVTGTHEEEPAAVGGHSRLPPETSACRGPETILKQM